MASTLSVALVFACLGVAASAQQPTHLETSLGWRRTAVTNAALDGRLHEAAAQYRGYAPIPRIALFDIAYPKDSAESAALGGNAVLVVIAVVQDSSELPLRRVYVTPSTASSVQLSLVGAAGSYTSDTVTRATFGRFRFDAAYLLPLSVRVTAGDLLIDFGAHRDGFRLIRFDGDVPDPIRALGTLPSTPARASPEAVWSFIRREYPDLASGLGR